MKKELIRNCIWGVPCGMVLYILSIVVSELIYIDLSTSIFNILFFGLIILGSAIAVVTITYKKPTIIIMIIRFITINFFYGITFVVNGYIGTVLYFNSILDIKTNSASDNVSGMMLLTFIVSFIIICIITIAVMVIIKSFLKIKSKK